jgi:hypothetical protein
MDHNTPAVKDLARHLKAQATQALLHDNPWENVAIWLLTDIIPDAETILETGRVDKANEIAMLRDENTRPQHRNDHLSHKLLIAKSYDANLLRDLKELVARYTPDEVAL